MSDETQFRLPTDVKPVHYDITFRTDLVKETFDGFVVAQSVLCFFYLLLT
jgi:hypothetical protein